MYKKVMVIIGLLLLTSCVNSPTTRGGGSSNYATRDVEVVLGDEQTYPRIALVIGNNNYQRNKKLTNAVPDARAIRDFFTNRGFKVIYAENANRETMSRKISEFISSLDKKSVSVIYYAGHASQDKSRKTGEITNYLVPVNDSTLIRVTDYDRDAISFNNILSTIDEINHGLNIAMLDACRTPIGRGGYIQNISAEGIYLVYSTASKETASDSGDFRKSFLKYAQTPLKLNDIFLAVKRDLIKTGQKPSIIDDSNGGLFYFSKPKPKPVVTPTPIATPQVIERVVYRDRPQQNIKNETHSTKEISIINGVMYQNEPFSIQDKENYDKYEEGGRVWSWEGANKYCQDLTLAEYNDWRLPDKNELRKLLTENKNANSYGYQYAINKKFVENMPPLNGKLPYVFFWSSTERNSIEAWKVDFKYGLEGWH